MADVIAHYIILFIYYIISDTLLCVYKYVKLNIFSDLLVDKYSNTDWLQLRDLLSCDFNRVPLAIPVSRVSSSVALGN